MMTNSVVPTAQIAAAQLLNLNATDGNVGLWLATTTPFGEILSLDQFPAVPGSGPGYNEVSVFASDCGLPCRPVADGARSGPDLGGGVPGAVFVLLGGVGQVDDADRRSSHKCNVSQRSQIVDGARV